MATGHRSATELILSNARSNPRLRFLPTILLSPRRYDPVTIIGHDGRRNELEDHWGWGEITRKVRQVSKLRILKNKDRSTVGKEAR